MDEIPEARRISARRHDDGKRRCAWCPPDALYMAYHDAEWGVPVRDDRQLFEMLCLEGAQAGLSWITVLRKRETYRAAFDDFDAAKMARYSAARIKRLMQDPGIVRNRLKIESFVSNAQAYLKIAVEPGDFSDYIWQFAGGKVIRRRPQYLGQVGVTSPVSDAMSRDLKRRGFRFVGSTICYAFMQAVGIVNEHQKGCFAASR